MKYTWKATSDDGCYEDKGRRWFDTKKEAYEDMREYALEKMQWNTEWEDVDENNTLGYEVHFSRNKIVHESYSGTYTYEIVEHAETIRKHNRTWDVLDSFLPTENDWKVGVFDELGTMWMNNMDGYMILIEENGRILKSDI